MAQLPSIDLSWLGGGVGGMLRGGRDTNAGGSAYGGKRTLGKDFLEGVGTATDEQFASDAKKARSLRTYLAEIDPTLKDRVQAMGLEGLEGHAMSLAEKKLAAKQKLNEEFMQQQIASMKSAADERARDATATQEFGKAMQPPLSGSDYMGQFLDPAAPVNLNVEQANPLQAYFAAVAKSGGGAPDLRHINALAQFAPEARAERDFVPQPFSVNGMDGIYSPGTGAIHVKPTPGTKATSAATTAKAQAVDPFDRMDYAELNRTLSDLEKEYLKTTSVDARSELVGSMNRIKKSMQRIRGGGQAAPAAAPAAAPQAAAPAMRFGLVNGQLMPLK